MQLRKGNNIPYLPTVNFRFPLAPPHLTRIVGIERIVTAAHHARHEHGVAVM